MAGVDYLIVVNDIPTEQGVTHASDIVRFLFSKDLWVFSDYTGYRKLHVGDRLIVYLAGQAKAFVAEAKVATEPQPVDDKLRGELGKLGLTWFGAYVRITDRKRIEPPKLIRPLIPRLKFITDKKNYGLALRLGLRRLPKEDAKLIVCP